MWFALEVEMIFGSSNTIKRLAISKDIDRLKGFAQEYENKRSESVTLEWRQNHHDDVPYANGAFSGFYAHYRIIPVEEVVLE